MKYQKIGFIGLGLIGGSIAKKIKMKWPETTLIGHASRRSTLEQACQDGIIENDDFLSIDDFLSCDLIYFCSPVQVNCEYLEKLRPRLRPETLLTDVGSVKGDIQRTVRSLGISDQFIGGHPMAGSETIGYANSSPYLLQNAYYILTSDPELPRERLSEFREFVHELGAIPIAMTPDQHDFATAAISHLPHLISASLVNLVRQEDTSDEILKTIAAGGFRDITRISSSSPVMWQNICLANSEEILKLLDLYEGSLDEFRQAIKKKDGDTLIRLFMEAKEYRDSLPITDKGAISSTYQIYLFIEDQVGQIADVSRLLAEHKLNIQNIGIIHNREFEDGVLRIEMYNQKDKESAETLLKENGFQIRRKS